ncbi:hypothetical protein OIU78_021647 [Salix suchowensis]|nr:hypothetical protein OIU78_021647 [Salix suchowensis]
MSVSSPEPTPSPDLITEQLEIEKSEIVTSPVQTRAPPERFCELEDSKPNMEEIVLSSESEKNNVISDVPDFKFQVCHPNSPLAGDQVEWLPQPEMISKSDTEETPITIISLPNQTVESEVNSKTVTDSLPCKQELEGEQPDLPRRSLKRGASEQLDTEEKKFVYGSRKSSSPVLIASQAKYEELSSKASLNRSSSFSHQDSGIESNSDISGIDTELRTKELDMTENSVSHISRVQYGSSECGTELSVTSTLDSPDAFEVGAAELEHGAKFSEEETRNPNRTKFLDIKDKDSSKDPVSNLSHAKEPEKLEVIKGESANTIVAADSTREEMNPEISVSDVKRELSSETGGPAYRSSPEASPRSHLTVPGSQGTPSSQLSVKAKKSRADRSSSSQKHKSSSASKRSPSNPNHDSGASSVEQLSKDQKNGKRRNSFGSPKPDSPDQEPRDSSSSSPSLPRFMKATESARAKVNANNSPRSSPDVQDRDFIKKRHSLPGANGRHGSPLIQRSTSQAQHGAKGNGSQIAHEKKWQR